MTLAPYCKTWGDTGRVCDDPNCKICVAEKQRRAKLKEDRTKAINKLREFAEKPSSGLDLDEEVHQIKAAEASMINNEGPMSQILYLEEQLGLKELQKLVERCERETKSTEKVNATTKS